MAQNDHSLTMIASADGRDLYANSLTLHAGRMSAKTGIEVLLSRL